MTPPPKYLIVDSKYLGSEAAKADTFAPKMSATKNHGTQLNNQWITDNLDDQFKDVNGFISAENRAKIDEISDAIALNDDSICVRIGAKVDNTGNVTYYKYGSDGKVLKEEVFVNGNKKNIPVIWNKE